MRHENDTLRVFLLLFQIHMKHPANAPISGIAYYVHTIDLKKHRKHIVKTHITHNIGNIIYLSSNFFENNTVCFLIANNMSLLRESTQHTGSMQLTHYLLIAWTFYLSFCVIFINNNNYDIKSES